MRHLTAILATALLLLTGCVPTKEARQDYVNAHDRPHRIEQAVLQGEVVTGMTKRDVRASWGKPDHINESYYQGVGARTQWCYGQYSSQCLYFESGKLTGWN